MTEPSEPPDLDALAAYLTSDLAPPDCMDLSQLDGFLTGVAIGPSSIMPDEFVAVIWGGDEPEFSDDAEEQIVLGAILGRYNEIEESLRADPSSYAPVFYRDATDNWITEDWAVGFMQAVALRSEAWAPVLLDEERAMLLIPIGVIAGMAEPEVGLHDVSLPDGFLDELMEEADEVLPGCVLGLHAFWLERAMAEGNEQVPDKKRQH